MIVMGFSHHPGPLPFTTIRARKWENWLVELPMLIECKGEHGNAAMGSVIARAVSVERYTGECPAHLAEIYKGRILVAVRMEEPGTVFHGVPIVFDGP